MPVPITIHRHRHGPAQGIVDAEYTIIPTRRPAACNSAICLSLTVRQPLGDRTHVAALFQWPQPCGGCRRYEHDHRPQTKLAGSFTRRRSGRMVSPPPNASPRRPFTASKRASRRNPTVPPNGRQILYPSKTLVFHQSLVTEQQRYGLVFGSTLPDTPRPETLAKSLTGYRWNSAPRRRTIRPAREDARIRPQAGRRTLRCAPLIERRIRRIRRQAGGAAAFGQRPGLVEPEHIQRPASSEGKHRS